MAESTEQAGSKVPDTFTDNPATTPSTADDTYQRPVVGIPAPTKPDAPMPDNSQSPKSTKTPQDDAMDIDQKPREANAETEASQSAASQTNPPTATSADTQTVSEGSQTGPSPTKQSQQVTLHLAPAPATPPLDTQAPPTISNDAAPVHTTPPEINGGQGHQPESALPAPLTSPEPHGFPAQADVPDVPQLPPVIEKTGRNLTILENFDDKTAHSKKYSMYFNARKPPRLTSM